MNDPVLDREMFRKPEGKSSSEGVVSLVKGESDYERRKKQAAELLSAAKERQDPEKYKTLSEQSKPGVFRPVATGQPQAPQPNTQQQMAQMQAMGFRPVGMADGGYVQHFADGSGPEGVMPTIAAGPNALYTMPDVGLRIGNSRSFGQPAIRMGSDPVEQTNVAKEANTQRSSLAELSISPPATWTDEDINAMADEIFLSKDRMYRESTAKTPAGRGLQSLNPFRREPDRKSIIEDLKQQREIARRYGEEEQGAVAERGREEERGKVMRENRVPSIFEEIPVGVREQALAKQQEKLRAVDETIPSREPQATASAEGINSLTGFANARAAARDVYEPRAVVPKEPVAPEQKASDTEQFTKPTDIESIKAARNSARQENINLALIQAGLAMAGGQSPNALTNIAAGGISGIQAFQAAEKSRRAEDVADRELASKEKYYGILESKAKALEGQQAERSRIAMANARIKGQQAADNAYSKWLTTTEGQMAKQYVRDAKQQSLLDAYTKAIYNDYLVGGGSSSSDRLGILGSSEE